MSSQKSTHAGRIDANPEARFVMKNRNIDKWVLKTNRMKETADPRMARRFSAEWLNSTCWDWEPFYVPKEATP